MHLKIAKHGVTTPFIFVFGSGEISVVVETVGISSNETMAPARLLTLKHLKYELEEPQLCGAQSIHDTQRREIYKLMAQREHSIWAFSRSMEGYEYQAIAYMYQCRANRTLTQFWPYHTCIRNADIRAIQLCIERDIDEDAYINYWKPELHDVRWTPLPGSTAGRPQPDGEPSPSDTPGSHGCTACTPGV